MVFLPQWTPVSFSTDEAFYQTSKISKLALSLRTSPPYFKFSVSKVQQPSAEEQQSSSSIFVTELHNCRSCSPFCPLPRPLHLAKFRGEETGSNLIRFRFQLSWDKEFLWILLFPSFLGSKSHHLMHSGEQIESLRLLERRKLRTKRRDSAGTVPPWKV